MSMQVIYIVMLATVMHQYGCTQVDPELKLEEWNPVFPNKKMEEWNPAGPKMKMEEWNPAGPKLKMEEWNPAKIKTSHVFVPVLVGSTVVLNCSSELQEFQVQAVIWSHEGVEFYSFQKNATPPYKTTNIEMFNMNVAASQRDRVVLENVNPDMMGDYQCLVIGPANTKSAIVIDLEIYERRQTATLASSYDFVPVAVETLGPWGREAELLIDEIGRLTSKGLDPRSGSFLMQRLAIAIQRGNAASVMGSFAPGTTRGGLFDIVPAESGPVISFALNTSKMGELSAINCTSSPSRPAANLTWLINGKLMLTDQKYSFIKGGHAITETSLKLNFPPVPYFVYFTVMCFADLYGNWSMGSNLMSLYVRHTGDGANADIVILTRSLAAFLNSTASRPAATADANSLAEDYTTIIMLILTWMLQAGFDIFADFLRF